MLAFTVPAAVSQLVILSSELPYISLCILYISCPTNIYRLSHCHVSHWVPIYWIVVQPAWDISVCMQDPSKCVRVSNRQHATQLPSKNRTCRDERLDETNDHSLSWRQQKMMTVQLGLGLYDQSRSTLRNHPCSAWMFCLLCASPHMGHCNGSAENVCEHVKQKQICRMEDLAGWLK